MKEPKICYVISYSSDTDDYGEYHIVEVCATRELAEEEVEKMRKSAKFANAQALRCDKCYDCGYKIDGVRPDCFVNCWGDCWNMTCEDEITFMIDEVLYYE